MWGVKIVAAAIMLQTLYFKFSAAEESVYIFTQVGIEPWGRIATGIFELVASILLLVPAASGFGALLGIGLMSGALFFHATRLGIEVKGDGGQLFIYAVIVWLCCAVVVWRKQKQLLQLIHLKK